jgi:S1-C subfamily serine protease
MVRYYSRRQTVFFCFITALTLFLLLGFTGQLKLGAANGHRDTESAAPSQALFSVAEAAAPVYDGDEENNIALYASASGSVVYISTEVLTYNWFYEAVPGSGGTGSGFIVDSSGYALTNYHVVRNAHKVFVSLDDGVQYEGEVTGFDAENDIALIRFDSGGKELKPLVLGSSGNLKVGQKVLAIGNPYIFERTMSSGIISGLGRPLRGIGGTVIQNMIQTDASINPGNSGGPLLNTRGEVIGMTTMIYSPSGGSVGIGFAVPADTIRRVLPDLLRYGAVRRGILDISYIFLSPALARYARLPVSEGLLVSETKRGGKAESAGLRGGQRRRAVHVSGRPLFLGGDIIVALNGVPLKRPSDYFTALEQTRPGQRVEAVVLRGNTQLTIEVELVAREE